MLERLENPCGRCESFGKFMDVMDISSSDKGLYVFGSFVLDPLKRTLLRDGVPVPLSPKVFDTLLYLVEHPDRLLDKDELLEAVWPGRVVEENNLSHNISLLRKALNGDGALDRCIITSPGRSYRFTATPQRVPRTAYPGGAATATGVTAFRENDGNGARPVASPPRWRRVAWAAALLLPLAGALAYFAVTRFAAAPPNRASIAVLPFENLSSDRNNEYFTAGMQELILTRLADIGNLKVIARTSTQQYASHPADLRTIGQQLGVAAVLEGSVQKAGNRVLINVQLIDARTQSHVWAQAYTRRLDDVIGVEGEVARQVAAALDAKLSPTQAARLTTVPTANRTAWDLFLRAEYQAYMGYSHGDTASMKAAIALYRQAVEQDPGFALAHARLSFGESRLAWWGGGGEDVAALRQQAHADAERALQLQPDLAASHLAIGYSEYWGHANYGAALKAFSAALEIEPDNADAFAAQGYIQSHLGHFDKATAALQKALTLDPRNASRVRELGHIYMMTSRYPNAERVFQRALALDPGNLVAKINDAYSILLDSGDIPRALAVVQGNDPFLEWFRVRLLVDQRHYHEALDLLGSIPDTPDNFAPGNEESKTQQQADCYWLMGDNARARPLYEQALSRLRAEIAAKQGAEQMDEWANVAGAELGLGHTAQALDALAKAQAIDARIAEPFSHMGYTLTSAILYAKAGRADLAVPRLAKSLATPGIGIGYSPVMLWLDPELDPIRHDARFRALLAHYARYKPAVVYSAAASAGK
ncbi:MAG: Adenylate cyclase [Rhodanobacteraceae bacterium]|jgi:TolB-like protein/DNA-binding winged helix-turn-helix (wHTH) protein/Tfp pilus assembly protein PilF|nr:MAG: Adenylate cyclase [Rhodanobacteraceae bacterium]